MVPEFISKLAIALRKRGERSWKASERQDLFHPLCFVHIAIFSNCQRALMAQNAAEG